MALPRVLAQVINSARYRPTEQCTLPYALFSSVHSGPGPAADSLLRKLICGRGRRGSGERGAETQRVGVREKTQGG